MRMVSVTNVSCQACHCFKDASALSHYCILKNILGLTFGNVYIVCIPFCASVNPSQLVNWMHSLVTLVLYMYCICMFSSWGYNIGGRVHSPYLQRLGFIPRNMYTACLLSKHQRGGTGGSEVQGHLWLHSRLDYMRPFLTLKKKLNYMFYTSVAVN